MVDVNVDGGGGGGVDDVVVVEELVVAAEDDVAWTCATVAIVVRGLPVTVIVVVTSTMS